MATTTTPLLRQTVLDCGSPRVLAEFWRQLLGLTYRPGDEPPAAGEPDPRGEDWLTLLPEGGGGSGLAFQRVEHPVPATWPEGDRPQMLHLDTSVPDADELRVQHDRALALGATLLHDRFSDPDEPLFVFADPAGHPFCIFVADPL